MNASEAYAEKWVESAQKLYGGAARQVDSARHHVGGRLWYDAYKTLHKAMIDLEHCRMRLNNPSLGDQFDPQIKKLKDIEALINRFMNEFPALKRERDNQQPAEMKKLAKRYRVVAVAILKIANSLRL